MITSTPELLVAIAMFLIAIALTVAGCITALRT